MDKIQLKQRVISTSKWLLSEYWISQTLRICSHFLLVRFLLPEDFGLSQLVNVFIQGMLMFFDFGMGVNIVQHKRGEEPIFLQTVWTIEVIRGLILWMATFLLAYPLAALYDTPELLWLFPFAGSSLFLISFTSTNYFLHYRKMNISRITMIELTSNVLGIVIMIGFAWYWRSVWTLLTANIVYACSRSLLSNAFLRGTKMAFCLEREAVRDIIHFGKWILVSTINTFITSRLDLVVMGLYLDKTMLGFYGIASRIVKMFLHGVMKLNNSLLIPFYSRIKNDSPIEMRNKIFKVRLTMIACSLPIFLSLAIFGQDIVNLLYPESYQKVGEILQILAIGGAIQVTISSITPILLAHGDSFRHMLTQVSHSFFLVIPMMLGGSYYGIKGLILAIILSHLFNYPVIVLNVRKYGVWFPVLDFVAFSVSALIACKLFYLYL